MTWIQSTLCLALTICLSARASAADWLRIEDFGELSQRLSITVENPADADTDSALVHIRLIELADRLPNSKAGQIVVVDPSRDNVPKRDRANEYFVPFQINDDVLTFAVPLKALEKRQLYLYTAPMKLSLPGFPCKTGYDSRFAYRSFENDLMAFRVETGPGANTTGMAIDLFGKTAKGKGVRLTEIYESGHDSYHKLQYWGIDALKLGSSPGLGGAYVALGDQLVRPSYKDIVVDLVHTGPVETCVRMEAPVEVSGRKFTLVRRLILWAGERGIDDTLRLSGDDLSGAGVGIGLRNLPSEVWVERPRDGLAMVCGDNNQPNYKSVGLGAVFDPAEYVRTIDLKDQANGGHIYVLKGKREGGSLVSRHHLAAIWDGDGQINNSGDFARYLQRQARLLNNPPKVSLAERADVKP